MKKYPVLTTMILILVLSAVVSAQAQMAIRDQVQTKINKNEELLRTAFNLVVETNSTKARTLLKLARSMHEESKKIFQEAVDNYMQGHLVMAGQMMTRAGNLSDSVREMAVRAIAIAKKEAMTEERAMKSLEHARARYETLKSLLPARNGFEAASARDLAEEARVQLERSQDNMREHMFETALRLARLSESLSTRAIALLKRDMRAEDVLIRELDKTGKLIESIKEQYGQLQNPEAMKSYEQAINFQREAVQNMHAKNYAAALKITNKARQFALRAIKFVSSTPNADNVKRAIDLTDQLLDKASDMLKNQDSEQLRKRIEDARSIQEKAKREFRKGKLENAFELTRRTRSIINEGISAIASPLSSDQVMKALKTTDSLIERIRSNENIRGDKLALDLLDKSVKYQQRAWDDFNQARLKSALTYTKLARNLAAKAMEHIENGKI
jgi:hypothetical protein